MSDRRPLPGWLWTGAGLAGAVSVWAWASTWTSPIALPSPLATGDALVALIADGIALPALVETGLRVLAAFTGAFAIGGGLGVLAGTLPPVRAALGPLITTLLAIPPIAWVVLALLWFGTGGQAVVFTALVAVMPILFLAAMDAVRTVDPDLTEMARAFRLNRAQTARHLILPHVARALAPSAVAGFGIAWKVCVMAELLSARDGIGSGLADARTNLDTAQTFAWLVLLVTAFLVAEWALRRLLPPVPDRMPAQAGG